MLGNLLGNTDLKQIASFATPAFFDVMPMKALYGKAQELRKNARDPEIVRHAVALRQASLSTTAIPIELGAALPKAANGAVLDARAHAEAIVELYFHQLFRDEPVLLDSRPESFSEAEGRLAWKPAGWIATFVPDFVGPLRQIYEGFYAANDALFRRGLDALKLLPAEGIFRRQFGEDVHAVEFRTKTFTSTFHDVFVQCKASRTALHPDFVPLGIQLATMYQHLEPLGVTVDVAKCFARGRAS